MPLNSPDRLAESRGLAGRALVVAAVTCLVLAGVILWASRGEAVFSDVVLAALAWCF
jgi:hypothetical protein